MLLCLCSPPAGLFSCGHTVQPPLFIYSMLLYLLGCFQETPLRTVFLPRPDPGEEEVRAARLEHSIRVQRDRPPDLSAAATHVPGTVPGRFLSFQGLLYFLVVSGTVKCFPSLGILKMMWRIAVTVVYVVYVAYMNHVTCRFTTIMCMDSTSKPILEVASSSLKHLLSSSVFKNPLDIFPQTDSASPLHHSQLLCFSWTSEEEFFEQGDIFIW